MTMLPHEADDPEDLLAVTLGGVVLLNALYADGVISPQQALEWALAEDCPIFIGVPLTVSEQEWVQQELQPASREVCARILGRRQRRRR